MSDNHTIDLSDLSDHVTLAEDADTDSWPSMTIELTLKWNSAEPDVGIMSDYADITKVDYSLDGEWFTDKPAFIQELYNRIGDDIEESQDALAELISNRIENEELEQ